MCYVHSRMNGVFGNNMLIVWISVLLVIGQCNIISASVGDQSSIFQQCIQRLEKNVCNNQTRVMEMKVKQPIALKLTMWSCEDESKYHCMWAVVKQFSYNDEDIPQFYGKWPFIRFLGMQEPASALFSFLNGLSFYIMWKKFRRKAPKTAPTFYVWNGYAMVSINAWLWSTIFHTRDTPITEMLDYFCATSGVLYSFFGLCARILFKKSRLLLFLCASACMFLFVNHVYYLAFVNFDYGYNMKASVGIGIINSMGWLIWCGTKWQRQPYVWKCFVVVLSVNVLLLLELGDFPPLWWVLDAHSLWHLGTIPLPLLWFSFLIDDCHYMVEMDAKLD